MATATSIKTLTAALPVYNTKLPFSPGNRLLAFSPSTPVLYGVNSPAQSNRAKYGSFRQTIAGNRVFTLDAAANAPQNTTGGALSDANQLRVVGFVGNDSAGLGVRKRARGDQVAPTSGFIVGAGGGTAVADATISIKGTTAANLLVGSTLLSIASSGALTTTILVGDRLTVAGDSTVYTATATTISFDGTTEINVAINPPLQVVKVAAQAVTIAAADARAVIFAETIAVGSRVDIWVMDAADVIAIATLVASTNTEVVAYDVMLATIAADIYALPKA